MFEQENEKCYFHKGENIIANCNQYSCLAQTGRCKICFDRLEELGCDLAHITNLNDSPSYIEDEKKKLISYLTKLQSDNCWIITVFEGMIKTYRAQMAKTDSFNLLIVKTIDEINQVQAGDLTKNIEQVKSFKYQSIKESILQEFIDNENFTEKINKLTNIYSKIVKQQSIYVQSIIEKNYLNHEQQIFNKDFNLEKILESEEIIDTEIKQVKKETSDRLQTLPEFNKNSQEVQNLIWLYKGDILYQADIFKDICQICNIKEIYLMKYSKVLIECNTEEDRAHRMLSEYHFNIKNYPLSLEHLLKVKHRGVNLMNRLYFSSIRLAQIYYKLKDSQKLQKHLNLIETKYINDSYIFYLQAKLSILQGKSKQWIITNFEKSINQLNAPTIVYLKYMKYLREIGNIEAAGIVDNSYQKKKFLINCNHKDSNISAYNYHVKHY